MIELRLNVFDDPVALIWNGTNAASLHKLGIVLP
jgi:hypothetical protein